MNWGIYPNFEEAEFACRCCGIADMDPKFIEKLQLIREALGFPLVISSGFRCSAHNLRVGGGPAHPTGKAADVLAHGNQARLLVCAAVEYNIPRIGVSQKGPHSRRFIHLDILTDGVMSPWIWSY